MKTFSRHTETFIVRLWAEYLEQSPPAWRGEIEHVGDREVVHFGDLSEMGDYIYRYVMARHKSGDRKQKDIHANEIDFGENI